VSRTPFIAGNWKMNKTIAEAESYIQALLPRVGAIGDVEIVVCPPYTALQAMVDSARGSSVQVYAQNMHEADEGAFTGEVSAPMLVEIDVAGTILGHSERREYYNESDRALALKALRFLRHRGHQVLVLHIMDPAEVSLGGPHEAKFEDPETHATVVLRPRDWAGAYRDTIRAVVSEWRLACRRHGITYHRVTTDTPFGIVLREALTPPSRPA
jgi:hypothetical protein